MARIPEKVNFQLSVFPEDKAMIKADAKALGMPVAKYVVMVCKLANEAACEAATVEFAEKMTKAVMRGVEQGLSEKVSH